MNRKELFANYEFDNSKWNKTILRILGGSVALHVILFLSLIYVPAVRDAFYVAMLFSDGPNGWETKAYKPTEFETATIINLPSSDQLQYPEGYFELANGDAAPPDFLASTTNPTPEIIDQNLNADGFPPLDLTPSPTPTPAPPIAFPFPAPAPPRAGNRGGLPRPPRPRKGATVPGFEDFNAGTKPTPSPTPNKDATAETKPSPTPINPGDIKLNKEPWFKLGRNFNSKLKDLDLNQPVALTVKAKLDKDGKFVGKPIIVEKTGDPVMAEFALGIVAALDESEMLRHVKGLISGSQARDITFTLTKDKDQVMVKVVTDVGDEQKANTIQSGLNTAFEVAKIFRQGKEEAALLEKAAVTTNKKQVVITWAMPVNEAMETLKKKLAEIPKEDQPSSTGQNGNGNAQAVK